MPTKSQMPWLLAALVLIAYTHCVVSHGVEAAELQHQLRTVEQPLDSSRATCENESSCICKGATLALGVEAPEQVPSLVLVSQPSRLANQFSSYAATRRSVLRPDDIACCGASLRAFQQRFLL
ncbi:MAG: hypothetical protein H6822_32915 [Planctomycetaceae bacterium]|nr:hypothetical protein [Planctomycetales bacterium]MCB9926987.1 hypothetical protein [Planctomycetaceae bacterium]